MFCTTFNNKYFQFYVHCSTCCYRHLGRITVIPDGSKLLSFILSYCSHLLWVILIYTAWLVLPPYYCSYIQAIYIQAIYCSYFQVIYFQVTYIIFFTILLCFRRFSSAVRPLPPLWYQSHSFLAGGSAVVSLFLVRVCPNAWYSVVVFPSYRHWHHPSRKVNS